MSVNKKGNFKLYNASAGSGKTFTLIKEFLTLSLSSDNPSCKNILAVTFTNKAANEMKVKILDGLMEIMSLPSDKSDLKKSLTETLEIGEDILEKRSRLLYDNILHNYSDLSVSTIDSFVQKISRSFAKELNLPAQYRLLLDTDELLDELIQLIDKKINKNDELLTMILTQYLKFQIYDESSWRLDRPIKKFINKLLKESAYKRGEIFKVKMLDEQQYKDVEKYLDRKIHSFDEMLESVKKLREKYDLEDEDFYRKALPSVVNKINSEEEVRKILTATVQNIFDGNEKWYSKKGSAKLGRLENDNIDIVQVYYDLLEEYKSIYIIKIIRKDLYLYVLRGSLVNVINQYIEETNNVHISEFNKRISDIIGDCSVPFIYERIGEKYKHFFIDEFQDTSFLQWFNFIPLVNNSLSEGKMNLLVGDAKQAIYRFRNGEVEQIIKLPDIHTDTKDDLILSYERNFNDEMSRNYLRVNYRSLKNIVLFNNSFYRKNRIHLNNPEYRSVYEDGMEQVYRKGKDYDGYVNVEVFDLKQLVSVEEKKVEENNANDKKPRTEGALYKEAVKKSILNDINILVEENGYMYSDIAILVRNNADGSDIAEYLTNNGIRVISSDSILLKSSDKVQLIISALKYMMDEKNDVKRITLACYHYLCKNTKDASDLQDVIKTEIDEDKLFELRDNAYSLYDLCLRIAKMYGFNVTDDAFLNYFMNLVHERQNRENDDINSFIEYWDNKSDNLSVKSTSKENAVEIMTIHKSKGLAFNVVMYPYAYTKVPDSYKNQEKWLSFKDDFKQLDDIPHIEDFIMPMSRALVETKMDDYYREEYDKVAFDDFNLMYVAMTRPRTMLYIYTDNSNTNDNPCNFFTEYMDNVNEHYYSEVDEHDNEICRETFSYDVRQTDISNVYSLGEIRRKVRTESELPDEMSLDEDESYDTLDWSEMVSFDPDPSMFWIDGDDGYMPQEWGVLVHDILSKINTMDDAEDVLGRYVKSGAIDEKMSDELLNAFKKIADIDVLRDAYSKDAVVRNEMDILTKDGQIIRPDRYVELEDKVMVIDYKTGRHDVGYYRKQQDYMIALQMMGIEKKIEGYLLYIGENVSYIPVYLDRLF